MKTLISAMCASALAAATPTASYAQIAHMPGGWGGGWSHGGGMHGGFPGHGFGGHGFGGGHGFNQFRFNQRHSFRDFDHWRRRGRGDACEIMGYGYGCVSIAELPYLIFSLNDEIYCYDQHAYGRPRAIECPYDDWYDY